MKHLEGFDSIIVAAFLGGIFMWAYNEYTNFSQDKAQVIGAGAATGAAVQIALRLTGLS